MKLSARNQLKGKIASIEKDNIMGKVKIQIEVPATVTSLISKEAIEDLNLNTGDSVIVIVKSTSVMIAKDEEVKKPKK